MKAWARLVVATAFLRVVAILVAYLAGVTTPTTATTLPPELYAGLAVTFAAVGAFLVLANRNDPRAAWLGGALVLLAAPLTSALAPAASNPSLAWVDRLRPDALLGAFLWQFVLQFPSPVQARWRRAGRLVTSAVAIGGVALAAANLSILIAPIDEHSPGLRGMLATGQVPGRAYWPIVLVPCLGAFIALVVRAIFSSGPDQQRSRLFIAGLAAGVLPLFVEVLVEEAWPAYKRLAHAPSIEPWLGSLLFGALSVVPLVTAYAVVYESLFDVRLVVRMAVQWAMARYTILVATSVPFVALGVFVYQNRTDTLASLAEGPRPVLLIGATALGILILRVRRNLLAAIDRRFFREHYDAEVLVTNLLGDDIVARAPKELSERLAEEIDRTLHARADLFVLDDSGQMLVDPRGRRQPLALQSTLVRLSVADSRPLEVTPGAGPVLGRLPADEREWLDAGMYGMLLALRGRAGEPLGLLGIGRKRSEQTYSPPDRRAIGTLMAPLSLAIENDRLRRVPAAASESAAQECLVCRRLQPGDARRCPCGGALDAVAAPYLLRGSVRLERRLGAGGMGVVYRGTDLSLARDVAVKTLPRTDPRYAARLRREAMAMATLSHPHLAVIYGLETWNGLPFLIEEYLAGGTLADRLRQGPLDVGEALGIGQVLVTTLHALHASGVVHCDIKPSNIGFARDGTLKLLDFGLAHMLRDVGPIATTTMPSGDGGSDVSSLVITRRGVMGTPPYMGPAAIAGAEPSPAFDLWSTAVVVYECIAGRRPFTGDSAPEIFLRVTQGRCTSLTELRADCPPGVSDYFGAVFGGQPPPGPGEASPFLRELSRLRSLAT